MYQEIEVLSKTTATVDENGFIICDYCLRVFDKNKQKTIINRYITNEELESKNLATEEYVVDKINEIISSALNGEY